MALLRQRVFPMALDFPFAASADDVRAAHDAGVRLDHFTELDEATAGFRLIVQFVANGEKYVFAGRLFRAPTVEAANARVEHQMKRLLGKSSRIAGKLSAEFCEARDALQRRIEEVWAAKKEGETDLLAPGLIKVDWNHRAPKLRPVGFAPLSSICEKYEPQYTRFMDAVRAELRPAKGGADEG